MKAAAASLLMKSNLGAFMFHSTLRTNFWARGLASRLTRPAVHVRMRGGARPDNALLHRTTHCFKTSLCRADRSIGETPRAAARVVLPDRFSMAHVFWRRPSRQNTGAFGSSIF